MIDDPTRYRTVPAGVIAEHPAVAEAHRRGTDAGLRRAAAQTIEPDEERIDDIFADLIETDRADVRATCERIGELLVAWDAARADFRAGRIDHGALVERRARLAGDLALRCRNLPEYAADARAKERERRR